MPSKVVLPAPRKPEIICVGTACGIDIGSTSHFVAVPSDRDAEPVREFPAFTADLQRLVTAFDRALPARIAQLPDTSRLVTYLQDQWDGERYLLATTSTHLAAPIIIAWGEPVMARGGFHGVDPAMPLERFVDLVRQRQLRFAMVGDLSLVSRRMARNVAGNPVTDWIREHGRPVDPALWRDARLPYGSALYDLLPAGE